MGRAIGRKIEQMALGLAYFGGGVLLLLVALVTVSVLGRGLGDAGVGWAGPLRGDFELVEAGMAIAVFAFLPLCQLRAGHARADILQSILPPAINRGLDVLWAVIFCAALGVITWQIAAAGLEKSCLLAQMRGDWCQVETTFRLGLPIWWAYGLCALGGGAAVLTACARLWAALTPNHAYAARLDTDHNLDITHD